MLPNADNLILFGASTRAAAFSALRAGLRPWCADLFADADLQAHCPAMRLPVRLPRRLPRLDRRRSPRSLDVHRRPRKSALARRTARPPTAPLGQRLLRAAPRTEPRRRPRRRPRRQAPRPRRPRLLPKAARRPVARQAGLGPRPPIHFWTVADAETGPPSRLRPGIRRRRIASRRLLRRRQAGRPSWRLSPARRPRLAARRPVPLLRQCRTPPSGPAAAAISKRSAPPSPVAAAFAASSAWTASSVTAPFGRSRSIRATPPPSKSSNMEANSPPWPGTAPPSSRPRPGRRPRPKARRPASARPFSSRGTPSRSRPTAPGTPSSARRRLLRRRQPSPTFPIRERTSRPGGPFSRSSARRNGRRLRRRPPPHRRRTRLPPLRRLWGD